MHMLSGSLCTGLKTCRIRFLHVKLLTDTNMESAYVFNGKRNYSLLGRVTFLAWSLKTPKQGLSPCFEYE